MPRRTGGRWRRVVDQAVGVDGACTAVIPVRRRPNPKLQAALITTYVLILLALEFVPFNIVTNPPWMETIDRAWFVNPATVVAILGWLASGVTFAAGWKEGLLVGLGATVFGLIAWWGDTLHGYVSFSTPFYAEQVAAIVAFGIGGGPIDELAGRVRAQ